MSDNNVYGSISFEDQPFYRAGMTDKEYEREKAYLNDNIEDFFQGKYKPLWKQKLKEKKEWHGVTLGYGNL